jgi:D-beta-D-heptose 7-phosphate kinase/D-beta-D-heptose 1-phosphate adenosyltransferase
VSTDPAALAALVPQLAAARVLVAGDVMLDRFVYGEVERISPEAPIPVLKIARESAMLGGAGNVARNLAALGAKVELAAAIGDDDAGGEVSRLVAALDGATALLHAARDRRTTVKTRYVANGQQLLRADFETEAALAKEAHAALVAAATKAATRVGAVVLSDYDKGVVTVALARALIDAAPGPVIVDPKGADWTAYRGAALVTPNRRELAEASRMATAADDEVVAAARHMIATAGVGAVLATRGPEGMTLVTAEDATHLPARAREVFDVSGAGDTVVAVMAAGLAAGLAAIDAAALANVAAGIVVGRSGTAVAHAEEIAAALGEGGGGKLVGRAQALERVADWKRRGLKVGFANGCFDLIHPGHVSLLAQARAACDRLVVAINSDASVGRLKGKGRPVQDAGARAAVLGSLADVDLVVVFGDEPREADTPLVLIEALRPDVLVKGADYTEDKVVGAEIVKGYGGRIVLAELTPGQSTTATIARMGR